MLIYFFGFVAVLVWVLLILFYDTQIPGVSHPGCKSKRKE